MKDRGCFFVVVVFGFFSAIFFVIRAGNQRVGHIMNLLQKVVLDKQRWKHPDVVVK